MATKYLNSSDIIQQEQLDDITTCCICMEVFTDPKALPCIHTFCIKCLQEVGFKTGKEPGDEMPCPICRGQFKIPAEGFQGLPKNFVIEKLIQMSRDLGQSAITNALCSVCVEEGKGQADKETPRADTYCVDCKHKLCDECCTEHRRFKATKNHKLITIHEYESSQNAPTDQTSSVCELHQQNTLDVYCADCKNVVCAICFIEKHRNHDGSHVDNCLDIFRKQIKDSIEVMNECLIKAHVKKTELVKAKEEMHENMEGVECDVAKRKSQIQQLMDKHASGLLERLSSERQCRLTEIQMATNNTDAYISTLESFNSYCQGLMISGSARDVCCAIADVSVRALELQEVCQTILEIGIRDLKFCLRKSELEEDYGNLLGEIEEAGNLKPKKKGKQILLVEQSKEIEILRKKNEELRQERANCNAQIEKLKQELETNKAVINALQTSNDKEKADYFAQIEKLKQELETNKAVINALQTSNDKEKADYFAHVEKLKQELENNETVINTLQTSNDTEKAAFKSLVEKLKQELENNETTIDGLKQDLQNGKRLKGLHKQKSKVKQLDASVEKPEKEVETTKSDNLEPMYKPRLVHIKEQGGVKGFGFNLKVIDGNIGQIIGIVDPGSPAEAAGLRYGDRLLEVNGVNVEFCSSHRDVVRQIKSIPNETKLLVINMDSYEHYRTSGRGYVHHWN